VSRFEINRKFRTQQNSGDPAFPLCWRKWQLLEGKSVISLKTALYAEAWMSITVYFCKINATNGLVG
jgi:hypothetical protein